MDIMFLPDLHAPACDLAALKWAAEVAEQYSVDKVIQVGDFIDARAWSRFDQDPDFDAPQTEWDKTVEQVKEIARLFPELDIILGNHDTRPFKKAMQAGLPTQLIMGLEDLFPYPGWNWHLGPDTYYIEEENLTVIHGDELTGTVGLKASRLGTNLVQGHSHQGHMEYVPVFNKLIWGMDVGCLVDPDASNFRYAARNPRKIFRGVGLLLGGVPLLLPYVEGV